VAAPNSDVTIEPHYAVLRAVTGGPVPIGFGGSIQVIVGGESPEGYIAITDGMLPADVASAINDVAGAEPLFVATLDDLTGYLVVRATVPDVLMIVVPPFGDYQTLTAIGLPLEGKRPLIAGGTRNQQGTTDAVVAALDRLDTRVDGARAMVLPLQLTTAGMDRIDSPAVIRGTLPGLEGTMLLRDLVSAPGGTIDLAFYVNGLLAAAQSQSVFADETMTLDGFFGSITWAGFNYALDDDGHLVLTVRGDDEHPHLNGLLELRLSYLDEDGEHIVASLEPMGLDEGLRIAPGSYTPALIKRVDQLDTKIVPGFFISVTSQAFTELPVGATGDVTLSIDGEDPKTVSLTAGMTRADVAWAFLAAAATVDYAWTVWNDDGLQTLSFASGTAGGTLIVEGDVAVLVALGVGPGAYAPLYAGTRSLDQTVEVLAQEIMNDRDRINVLSSRLFVLENS